jgi:hypothetical protein
MVIISTSATEVSIHAVSPVLSALATVYRDAIEIPSTASVYRVLSRDSKPQHGQDLQVNLEPVLGAARDRNEHAFDPATGLYDERYFAVLVQQQVAAARRSLRPVSVVIFEIDSMGEADADTRQQALGVVGDVVRRTLRESDAACLIDFPDRRRPKGLVQRGAQERSRRRRGRALDARSTRRHCSLPPSPSCSNPVTMSDQAVLATGQTSPCHVVR